MTGSGNANGFDWSGLAWQVEGFAPPPDMSRTLVTVWIGVNDLYAGEADVAASVSNVVRALDALAAKGACQILVPNLPNITLAPAYQPGRSYAAKVAAVRALVDEFNRGIDAALSKDGDGFATRHPQLKLYRLDAHSLFAQLAQDGSFKNTADPWYGTYSYPAADGYMWWDEWHPMTEVHRRVAAVAAEQLRPQR
jgi:phospholipase/lecithinase/hemolysin